MPLPLRKGSPPLTRGKGRSPLFSAASARITPAYAGKRWLDALPQELSEDHPRLRGEKHFTGLKIDIIPGSPPLTRGKVTQRRRINGKLRITPAYAGKSPL